MSSLNKAIESPQSIFTSEFFGVNFVADFERIGDEGWAKFDEVASYFDQGVFRYPGGITSETVFDIYHPNASIVATNGGGSRPIMGAFDFAEFASGMGWQASFIVPTKVVHDAISGGPNQEELLRLKDAVYDFAYGILAAGGVGFHPIFEIGNEYETYMSARDYAAVVNFVAPLLQTAILDYSEQFSASTEATDNWATISVQTWTHVANENSSLTNEDLALRTSNLIEDLEPNVVTLIDHVSTHWYLKDASSNLSLVELFGNLDETLSTSLSILKEWESAGFDGLEWYMSEWNTSHKSPNCWGLAQVPLVLKTIEVMIREGVDQTSFWSAQYQATSLALPNGDLTAIGATMEYVVQNLDGYSVTDLSSTGSALSELIFVGDDRAVLFASNLSETESTSVFELHGDMEIYQIDRVGVLSQDLTSADGEYKQYSDLPTYLEPDLPASFVWTDPAYKSYWSGGFSPYQTVVFELSVADYIAIGSDADDTFIVSNGYRSFVGGAGVDVLDLSEASSAVTVDAEGNMHSWAGDNSFNIREIEAIVGSSFDDRIQGGAESNLIDGGAGNDYLSGGSGNNDITGGLGNDYIVSSGSLDVILCGPGNDFAELRGERTQAEGGKGTDTVAWFAPGTSVYIVGSAAGFELDGQERYSTEGFEIYVGSKWSDSVQIATIGAVRVNTGGGADSVIALAGEVEINLESGDDYCQLWSPQGSVSGGSGNDFIALFGGGIVDGGIGQDTLVGSKGAMDTFVFSNNSGKDEIWGFEVDRDLLVFSESQYNAMSSGGFSVAGFQSGCLLEFTDGSSVFLHDVSQADAAIWIDEFGIV